VGYAKKPQIQILSSNSRTGDKQLNPFFARIVAVYLNVYIFKCFVTLILNHAKNVIESQLPPPEAVA
jgi:hypothetical protein